MFEPVRTVIPAGDGFPLRVAQLPAENASKAVILANANWLGPEFLYPLMRHLHARGISVYAFETRGSGKDDPELDATPSLIADDIACIARYASARQCVVLGYCSGCESALYAAYRYPEVFDLAILMNGAFSTSDVPKTVSTKYLEKIMLTASESMAKAKFMNDVFQNSKSGSLTEVDARDAGEKMVELESLLSEPYRKGPAMLHRFAKLFVSYLNNDIDAWAPEVATECVFVASGKDQIVHPDAVKKVAGAVQRGRYVLRQASDHYALFLDAKIGDEIFDLVSAC